ncbi:hypothetical protein FRACA_90067 [Frankia canadensis]|uniref:Uncharacterized protein n=1 Tax=Frankia canadensis TaxID=1836972 RepID=A0A2I2L2C2_9ACTN|nr:hypothetical protein FRACA_90067 [Frankia canadensis]SOU59354.1 hypothetical protein FRACA_90067 [Frankia canadensis]
MSARKNRGGPPPWFPAPGENTWGYIPPCPRMVCNRRIPRRRGGRRLSEEFRSPRVPPTCAARQRIAPEHVSNQVFSPETQVTGNGTVVDTTAAPSGISDIKDPVSCPRRRRRHPGHGPTVPPHL